MVGIGCWFLAGDLKNVKSIFQVTVSTSMMCPTQPTCPTKLSCPVQPTCPTCRECTDNFISDDILSFVVNIVELVIIIILVIVNPSFRARIVRAFRRSPQATARSSQNTEVVINDIPLD